MAKSRYTVGLVFLTFFVISLLTNILGPIVPDIISSFHVSLTAAGFLAFAFFIAYGVRSEEHTSELQSLRHLVCRLLLEKKKQHHQNPVIEIANPIWNHTRAADDRLQPNARRFDDGNFETVQEQDLVTLCDITTHARVGL